MTTRKFIKAKKAQEIEIGSVVVAQPFWKDKDEIYRRSVIILLDHDDKGSTGIILNKPSTLFVGDALPSLKINPPLYYGGAFDMQNISYIHNDQSIPEAIYLGNDLFYGGNFENIQEMILNKRIDLRKIKFFAGIVEWSSGQLESEIFENKWWTSELCADEFFTTSAEELWSYELVNNGHLYGLFDGFPDPCLN